MKKPTTKTKAILLEEISDLHVEIEDLEQKLESLETAISSDIEDLYYAYYDIIEFKPFLRAVILKYTNKYLV